MTDTALLITVAAFIMGLVLPASIYRERGFSAYLFGSAAIITVILGITILGSPIEYVTGTTIVESGLTHTITHTYTELPNTFNLPIGLILTMAGLVGMYSSFQHQRSLDRALKDKDDFEPIPN